MSAGDKCA